MLAIFFLIIAFLAIIGKAQTKHQWTFYGRATTTWAKIQKSATEKINSFEVVMDTTSTDTLWIAYDDDTTSTNPRPFPLLTATDYSTNVSSVYLRNIYLKTSANTIPYRVRLH